MKNSLDALQGHGAIAVRISSDEQHVMIDVKDTGKGIPKSNWKRIFEPGFTTRDPRLGPRAVARAPDRRGVPPG